MPKRNTYHSRGDFFWAKQEDNETPEEHWRKLVSLEKNCEFKDIKQADLLKSKFITSITDKKLREKLIREKTLNLKNTMDLVTQDSYEKRHKQSTIPPALAKEKEIKEEPLQKIQPRNYRKNTEITAKQLRFLWTAKLVTITQMPGKNGRMQQTPQNGTLCKSLPQQNQ